MRCVFKFSRPVQENSGGALAEKLDYELKGALVDIIPGIEPFEIFCQNAN
jgi:hypothetical protein